MQESGYDMQMADYLHCAVWTLHCSVRHTFIILLGTSLFFAAPNVQVFATNATSRGDDPVSIEERARANHSRGLDLNVDHPGSVGMSLPVTAVCSSYSFGPPARLVIDRLEIYIGATDTVTDGDDDGGDGGEDGRRGDV